MLYDNHGRLINYVRLAVTDRCNLRCFYCMPEEGIQYVPKTELMTYEEMARLIQILVNLGIEKVRITGGEPFVRKDLMLFLKKISQYEGLKKIALTTNGTLTAPLVPELKQIGITSVNLSLDCLDKRRFFEITRRDAFDDVMQTFESLLKNGIETKINAVVMQGKNEQDLIPLAELTRNYSVNVRFIEEMPFNGEGVHYQKWYWNHVQIVDFLKQHYPNLEKIADSPHTTAYNYHIPNYLGNIGVIAAYSRTFCGTCNRIRVTPQGLLKTCLYDDGIFNIKTLFRAGASDGQIVDTLLEAVNRRYKDGFEAEKNRSFGLPANESMTTIGG